MAIKRTIECDVCGATEIEQAPETGWQGWGAIQGVALDGVANPNLCPSCLGKVMQYVDEVKHGLD